MHPSPHQSKVPSLQEHSGLWSTVKTGVVNGFLLLIDMAGFASTQHKTKTATYWVASYTKDNEDEPFGIHQKVLTYKPGQDRDKLIIKYCNSIMRINKTIWEILVHQGPNEIPDNGDQIVLRLSREKFTGCTELKGT